jgi:chromosome segregation ATPase
MIAASKIGDELKKLEEKAEKLESGVAKEQKLKAEAIEREAKAAIERDEMQKLLEEERGKGGDYGLRLTKMQTQKDDLESQIADAQEKLVREEEARTKLGQVRG